MLLPHYGTSTLGEVFPAVAARLGVPGFVDVLGLPDARRYVVLLIDGLGSVPISGLGREAPLLSSLVERGFTGLTAGAPSTTATSITSLLTGLTPGQHGIVGYTFRPAAHLDPMNALSWAGGPPDVTEFQPHDTVMQQCQRAGVATSVVALRQHQSSGLTQAALRGADYLGLSARASDEDVVATIARAARTGSRSVVYAYERRLDHVGHAQGCRSYDWAQMAATLDELVEKLRRALGPEVCLLVTGDHGMVDVPADTRIIIDEDSELSAELSQVAGEARFRHLYTPEPDSVAARWVEVVGDRALIRTRAQAIEEGWFGTVDARIAPRIGDVVVAATGTWALLSVQSPQEFSMVGFHGSLTPAEMRVPLACATDVGWGSDG